MNPPTTVDFAAFAAAARKRTNSVKSSFVNSRTKNLFQVINGRVGRRTVRADSRQRTLVVAERSTITTTTTATNSTSTTNTISHARQQSSPVIKVPANNTGTARAQRASPTNRSRGSSTLVGEKNVTLQNYLNILTLIDGLKYQLPIIGSDLCCPVVVDLLSRNASVQSSRTVNSFARNVRTSSIKSTGFLGDESVATDMFSSSDWANLLYRHVEPLLSVLSVAAHPRSGERGASITTKLKTCFQINRPMQRLDMLCGTPREVTADHRDDETLLLDSNVVVGGAIGAVNDATVDSTNNGNSGAIRKFLMDLRTRHTRYVHDINAAGLEVSIGGCDCCFYSPNLFLLCSTVGQSTDGAGNEANDTLREMFRVTMLPSVLFDISVVLCCQMDAVRFGENFCLKHVIANESTHGDTFAHLAKTIGVAGMEFYRRLYVLHLCLNVIVNWLWSRQRVVHTSLYGKRSFIRDLPPVTLLVNRELLPLLRKFHSVAWLALEKSRKIIVHVV